MFVELSPEQITELVKAVPLEAFAYSEDGAVLLSAVEALKAARPPHGNGGMQGVDCDLCEENVPHEHSVAERRLSPTKALGDDIGDFDDSGH